MPGLGDQVLRYCATERSRDGDTYVYDIALRTDEGEVVERWEGLRLRAVRRTDGRGPWVAPLLGPYLQRSLDDIGDGVPVAVAVEPDQRVAEAPTGKSGEHVRQRRARTALALGRALGRVAQVGYRPDGRPELAGESDVSAAHGAGLTLAVVGAVGCDLEEVIARDGAVWQELLGSHTELARLVARDGGESFDTAATRVWAALECLQKAGRTVRAPLTAQPAKRAGWAVFASGELRIATLVTTVRDRPEPVVFAIATKGRG